MQFQALFFGGFVAVALLGLPAGAQQTTTASSDANDFAALVKRAEKARRSNDPVEAVKAYRDALKLHHDPTIAGRLGLILIELQNFDLAAHQLHDAMETPSSSVSEFEYAKFARAYKDVQQKVCRVDVTIDRRGARLEVDGTLQQEGKSEYWFFTKPGTHALRVTLEGFEDETKTITVERGSRIEVEFLMRPLPKPEPIAGSPELSSSQKPLEPPPVQRDNPSPKTNPNATGWFVLGAGVALGLFATPTPALGPQVFTAWRSRSWWEIGFDARVGWTFVEDDQFPDMRFVTWSAGITPCGRWLDRWFACAVVQLDGVARDDAASGRTFLPGVGARGGLEIAAHDRLRFQAWADVVAHHQGFHLQNNTQWSGSFMTLTIGVRGAYTF